VRFSVNGEQNLFHPEIDQLLRWLFYDPILATGIKDDQNSD
jgi:hypothetical protein